MVNSSRSTTSYFADYRCPSYPTEDTRRWRVNNLSPQAHDLTKICIGKQKTEKDLI